MSKRTRIHFTKLHGLGNDFIVVRAQGLPRSLPRLARAICRRTTGIGADGLLVLAAPRGNGVPASLRFFNSDGSEAEMSGNGIRCAGAYMLSQKLGRSPLAISTPAGLKFLRLIGSRRGKWHFRVAMGRPILNPAQIPFTGEKGAGPVTGFRLRTKCGDVAGTVTSMGNPHCSIFVRDFAKLDWQEMGREIERDKLFPHRTNVEFVKILSSKAIEVRYWERGVGKTMSSGTGSCAAAVASILNGKTGRKVRVHTLAGI
ncbi:MAG: diaminopimelate epimerase, partial [Acidobacteria bacterium]|nr:diaminopimelate epimerase [Acidobacteriota bacterium]